MTGSKSPSLGKSPALAVFIFINFWKYFCAWVLICTTVLVLMRSAMSFHCLLCTRRPCMKRSCSSCVQRPRDTHTHRRTHQGTRKERWWMRVESKYKHVGMIGLWMEWSNKLVFTRGSEDMWKSEELQLPSKLAVMEEWVVTCVLFGVTWVVLRAQRLIERLWSVWYIHTAKSLPWEHATWTLITRFTVWLLPDILPCLKHRTWDQTYRYAAL